MPALRVNTDNDARKISHEEGEAAMQTARTKGKGREGKERVIVEIVHYFSSKKFPSKLLALRRMETNVPGDQGARGGRGRERESFLKAERKLGRVASTLLVSCYNLQRA